MTEKIKEKIFRSEPFLKLAESVSPPDATRPLLLHGVAGSLMAFVAASVFENRRSQSGQSRAQVLLITPEKAKAETLRDDSALLLGGANVRHFDERPSHSAERLDMSGSIAQIETLKCLSAGTNVLVVASAQSIVSKIPLPDRFADSAIELRVGSEHSLTALIDKLNGLGFIKREFVEGYGDYSVRGGIVDVFAFVGDNPVRVEFWGDNVESIREFDILSQRSIRELELASIVADIARSDNQTPMGSIFDYLKDDAVIILDEPELIQREIDELLREGVGQIFDWRFVKARAQGFPRIIHSAIRNEFDGAFDHVEIDFGSARQPSFNGSIKAFVRELERYYQTGFHIYLTCGTKEEGERLQELIDEEITQPDSAISVRPELQILHETPHAGFIFPSARLTVFTEHEIFGRLLRRGSAKRSRLKGFTQKELQQLKRGDYIIHSDYGVGQFDSLQKISVRGIEQEVMKVLYLENDVLYVNLNFINRIEKYSSREGHLPKLSKLGAPDWERLKRRAKRRIKDIARDLIQLYARRKNEKGLAFSPDAHWQKEMEASFMYEDTVDQARATSEVKRDMETDSPMDRLICGDVGFGKTEVACRAAFKAVLDGKQVAILVPTTILAQQHYNTFKDRLGRYPVRVEFISRFKTKKEQQAVLGALAEGGVDIIIGTHRLLSKDVRFKDLGLLVIDEEHRFGVAAKEKIRHMKANVDTLTLTATPIPRTLHLSLMGARDISLITTPPRNRLPIVTEIVQFDWNIIREAILKELHRGGQVYFVHDRIQKIEEFKSLLEEHIPEAKFAIAHGQMAGHQLEKVMANFLERKYDVLVCTKIIESGIDIPNVNTILTNRADRFGLAELYQLRGRVGRSNVQAYAYLLTPPISVLPREAIRRLQAIEEFSELGSGFNLAMRDLEIRGVGNLLGAEQSGFIVEMGYEMYERIVREAVQELKSEEFNEVFEKQEVEEKLFFGDVETIIDADVEALIPEFYVESDSERLEIYRRLYRVKELREVDEMRAELRDRFGEYPLEIGNLFSVVELRLLASKLVIRKLTLDRSGLVLSLPREDSFYARRDGGASLFQELLDRLSTAPDYTFALKQEKKNLTLVFKGKMFLDGGDRLATVKKLLTHLLKD